MFVVNKGNEWLTEYATGGFYWTILRSWASKFKSRAEAQKAVDVYGGEIEPYRED